MAKKGIDIKRKKYRMRRHAKLMALKRYGIIVNAKMYRNLVVQIKSRHQHTYVRRLSNARSLQRVKAGEVEMLVVFDQRQGEIVTVLNEDMEVYEWAEEPIKK